MPSPSQQKQSNCHCGMSLRYLIACSCLPPPFISSHSTAVTGCRVLSPWILWWTPCSTTALVFQQVRNRVCIIISFSPFPVGNQICFGYLLLLEGHYPHLNQLVLRVSIFRQVCWSRLEPNFAERWLSRSRIEHPCFRGSVKTHWAQGGQERCSIPL